MRCLHRAAGRPAGECLPRARHGGGRAQGHDDRWPRGRAAPPPRPAGLYRSRRLPVRVLYLRPDHVGGGVHRRGAHRLERGNPRVDERQYLSLLRLSSDRRRRRSRCQGESVMHDFSYAQANSRADAIALAGLPDTMVLAGGTELLNWTRIGIVEPARIVDITRIPGLEGVEALPNGGVRI